ncbi:hypothetical protein NBO_434g0002 [Nosema bombycis CQ1]|uniref:Uncharacterized protein n=1 Tax=Nosema bombycis (strain CQ1 / CVCC 102059) TaxID=578461 RepID=R0KP53_NOSB1|nr:hypothetical protein NBO_434g0002 [Nosema bombycis CQ1]|eukprot:EOB12471.1 hypothetical protein NBO_434g0002 [Nosema bombycis CQ1]
MYNFSIKVKFSCWSTMMLLTFFVTCLDFFDYKGNRKIMRYIESSNGSYDK